MVREANPTSADSPPFRHRNYAIVLGSSCLECSGDATRDACLFVGLSDTVATLLGKFGSFCRKDHENTKLRKHERQAAPAPIPQQRFAYLSSCFFVVSSFRNFRVCPMLMLLGLRKVMPGGPGTDRWLVDGRPVKQEFSAMNHPTLFT